MVWQGLVALVYGAALLTLGWRSRAVPRLRILAAAGIALGALALLGGALLLVGQTAGRGMALLASVIVLLATGWMIAQGLLQDPPARLGRAAMIAAASALIAAAMILGGCATAPVATNGKPILGIEEPSGVTRAGDRLLIVGDGEAGTWYSLPAPAPGTVTAPCLRVPLAPAVLARHRLEDPSRGPDLEAIGVLADGRVVVLSEDIPALLDERGVVAIYGELAERFGRGCEGLDIRDLGDGASRVAVLWEGGYPSGRDDQPAWTPRLFVHDIPSGASDLEVSPGNVVAEIRLQVPRPPGQEPYAQRFRAPALVWHRLQRDDPDSWGFIVLLSSAWAARPARGSVEECRKGDDGEALEYCHKWLQRFDATGAPVGAPFDLEPVLPDPIRGANWEGMGWLEPGRSLALVYDETVADRILDPQEAIVVPLPEGW